MFIIPAIDIKDGKCVRLRQGLLDQQTIYGDDPAVMAERGRRPEHNGCMWWIWMGLSKKSRLTSKP